MENKQGLISGIHKELLSISKKNMRNYRKIGKEQEQGLEYPDGTEREGLGQPETPGLVKLPHPFTLVCYTNITVLYNVFSFSMCTPRCKDNWEESGQAVHRKENPSG